MSIPAAAVTSGGRLMVNAGSTTAIVGRSRQWLIPVFTRIAKTSMMQTLELTRAPIIASHSAVRALCDHSRNLDDEQLRALARNVRR